jgi:predicted nucleotidyltransferase
MIVTLAERKEARVAQIRSGIEQLRVELTGYARRHRGRFWLYGSAASGNVRYDSDVDLLVDFEPNELSAAMSFAEDVCRRLSLMADLKPKSWCTDAFVDRIAPKALVLQ